VRWHSLLQDAEQVVARGAGCRGEASAAVVRLEGNELARETASWRRARHAGLETGPGMLHHGVCAPVSGGAGLVVTPLG